MYARNVRSNGYVCTIAGVRRSDSGLPMPRTVIGTGESESVPVVADSVVHKCDERYHLFPSRALFSLSSDPVSSLSLSLVLSFTSLRAAYSRRRATRARSRPIASDVPVRYPRARI